jgi:8-oxo-dGTP diphosphatase
VRTTDGNIPEFGRREPGIEYCIRPCAYGVIEGNEGRVAVVRTPGGLFLPGGGMEKGESLEEAFTREVLEECGLRIAKGALIGTADELCIVRGKHVRKRSTFYLAVLGGVPPIPAKELDHELIWMSTQAALAALTHESQKWALRAAASPVDA